MTLTTQGVGKYLARWGFTPQKPIKRAYEQRPEAVKQWLEEDYPTIAKRAKAEGAEIHRGDETGLRSDDVRGRSYAPAGKTPEIRVTNRREGLSVISTVTNRGKVRWKVFKGPSTPTSCPFTKRLIQDAQGTQIEVIYLPSYSSELNPGERLNADLKTVATRQAPARTQGGLKKATISLQRWLQKSPHLVRYAA